MVSKKISHDCIHLVFIYSELLIFFAVELFCETMTLQSRSCIIGSPDHLHTIMLHNFFKK